MWSTHCRLEQLPLFPVQDSTPDDGSGLQASSEQTMPLVRYVLFTSSVLLALLFFTDWYFPKSAEASASADVDRTVIRIHSSRRGPTAVPFDTSSPMPRATPEIIAAAEF